MSGRKQVTIDSSDYQRLRQAETQLRAVQHDLPEVLESLHRGNTAELQRRLEPLEQRQREFQRTMSQLHSEVGNLEAETARRLEQQQRDMRNALQDMAGRLRQETRTLLAEQEHRLTTLVQQEQERREQQVRHLQEQISAIMDDQQRKVEMACSWIEAGEAIHNFIEGHYRHQHFAPGALDRLARELRQARDNMALGTPEAALSLAQQAYHGLSDLRLDLERLEREWQLWRSAALDMAREVLALAQKNRQCQALDLEGKDTGIAVEVDYWTEGKWSALAQDISALIARVTEDRALVSTEELRRIAERTVPECQQRLEQVVEEARLAVIGSQLRINTADLVVQALEEKGFAVQDGTYEGDDMRHGYAAKVQHLDGSEVVVLVTPVAGEPGKNELQIHSYDEMQRTPHELLQRARELNQALQARGLEVGEPRATDAHADPTLRDLQQVRKRQPLRQRTTSS